MSDDNVSVNDSLTPPVPQTDPAKDPTQERIQGFLTGYGDLVKEHGVDFASYPVFVPDGQGGFKIIVQNTPVDIKNQPVRSPLDKDFIAK